MNSKKYSTTNEIELPAYSAHNYRRPSESSYGAHAIRNQGPSLIYSLHDYGPKLSEVAMHASEILKIPQQEDTLVSEMEGVIVGISEETVSVKFRLVEDDAMINFPKSAFLDKSILGFGRHIKYKIISRANGYRYQAFEPIEIKNNDLSEIESILNNIKLKV